LNGYSKDGTETPMASDNTSDQFEWVSAKAKCTAAVMFERLRAGVEQDVERRNALVGLDDGFRFEFSEEGEAFEVARLEGSRVTHAKVAALVRFERAGPRIHVRSEDVDVFFQIAAQRRVLWPQVRSSRSMRSAVRAAPTSRTWSVRRRIASVSAIGSIRRTFCALAVSPTSAAPVGNAYCERP
jgi:hypothetical protein